MSGIVGTVFGSGDLFDQWSPGERDVEVIKEAIAAQGG
jgi:hypothetical protein